MVVLLGEEKEKYEPSSVLGLGWSSGLGAGLT